MKSWIMFLWCACIATVLVGCGTEPLRSTTPVTPTAGKPNPTSPATTAPPSPATIVPPPAAPKSVSGIEGQALIGPTCPVARIDSPCPDKPYQATIVVRNKSGAEVKRFDTDVEGRFRVELPPGTYILVPQSPGKLPRAGELTVQVTSGQFTPVIISYDSGIR